MLKTDMINNVIHLNEIKGAKIEITINDVYDACSNVLWLYNIHVSTMIKLFYVSKKLTS